MEEQPGLPFRILMVCTGNLCRSPAAEYLLVAELRRRALGPVSIEVGSAGTHATAGLPMDESAALEVRRLGSDPSAFRSRAITERMAEDADLILTVAYQHRSYVLERVPRANHRTFTMLEFAQLATLVGVGTPDRPGLRDWVRRAAAARWQASLEDYDIPDPRGRSADVHRATTETILAAMASVATGLAG